LNRKRSALLHGLEERGLRLGRGAVDFVGEQDVREDRAWLEDELPASFRFLQHGIAGDVAGEQVGRKLDAARGQAQGAGEALDEFGLTQSR
jgi:hypothetical protein